MKKNLVLLVAGTLVFLALVAYPARLLWGESALLFSATAAGLCLVPTVVTLAWAQAGGKGEPHQQVLAILAGTGLRMLFVIGGGMVLYLTVPTFGLQRFWLWVIVFYLFTLTLEMVLLTRHLGTKPVAVNRG